MDPMPQITDELRDDQGERRRCRGDAGEGVISAAIAVLIVAFLGAAMWVGLSRMWDRTEQRTNTQVENIGSDTP